MRKGEQVARRRKEVGRWSQGGLDTHPTPDLLKLGGQRDTMP